VLRLLGGGLAGGLLAAAGMRPPATLAAYPTNQNDWVKQCKATGGTSKSVGIRKVRCCYPGVSCTTCDFNVNPPSCTDSVLREDVADPPRGDGVLTDQP
jgi:hypothetical protein